MRKTIIYFMLLLFINNIYAQLKPEVVLPIGHQNTISSSKKSYDNKYVATISNDNVAKIWKIDGSLVSTLKGHTDAVFKVMWSPKENLLLTISDDKTVIVWNPFTEKIINVLSYNKWKISDAAWSVDGKTIAVVFNTERSDISFNGSDIHVWNYKSLKMLYHVQHKYKLKEKYVWTTDEYLFKPISLPESTNIVNLYGNEVVMKSNNGLKVLDLKTGGIRNNISSMSKCNGNGYLSGISTEIGSNFIKNQNISPNKKHLLGYYNTSSGFLFFIFYKNYIVDVNPKTKEINFKTRIRYKSTSDISRNNSFKVIWSLDEEKAYIKFSGGMNPILLDVENRKKLFVFNSEHQKILWTKNNDTLITQTNYGLLQLWSVPSMKLLKSIDLGPYKLVDISFKNDMVISKLESKLKVTKLSTGEELYEYISFLDVEYFYKTGNGYYYTTKEAAKNLRFKLNGKLYSFEQFDLKYNRPDIVLKQIGNTDTTLIDAYNRAYLKRIKKMGFKEKDLNGDFHIPKSKIKNFEYLPTITDTSDIGLNLHFEDSKYKLDRINVWINDVAVYGTNGIDLRAENTNNIDKNIKLDLLPGDNKIQISCLNQKGAESYKETVNIFYQPEQFVKPNLYLITIGTSKYKDSRFNLQYAAKDAQDVANLFKEDKYFGKVITKTLTNKQVTKESIAKLKEFLKQATRNDQVIVFVAGHGVLDANLDYYLASNDIDFNYPEKRGIPYEELESILDGIQPLKKILFVDACHSGEIDKDEMELAEAANTEIGDVVFRSAGAGVVNKTNNLGLQNTSELTRELFTDLRRGTGATVVSSAGGGEYAMESGEWKNGLFTYSLINGIKSEKADLNKDGKIMLSELQKYVQNQVVELSGGKQQPTSRIENLTLDYIVWGSANTVPYKRVIIKKQAVQKKDNKETNIKHDEEISIKHHEEVSIKQDEKTSIKYNELIKIKKAGKIGFKNLEGNVIVPYKYDYTFINKNRKRYAVVFIGKLKRNKRSPKKGKYGLIDSTGQEVIPCKYEKIIFDKDDCYAVKYNEKWGLINTQGIEVISIGYDNINIIDKDFIGVKKYNKWSFINYEEKQISANKYDAMHIKTNEYVAVGNNESGSISWGMINNKGEEIIPLKYSFVYKPVEGIVVVKSKQNRVGYVNMQGKELCKIKYTYAKGFKNGLGMVKFNNKYGFINKEGIEVIPPKYDKIYKFDNEFAIVRNNNKEGFINKKGQEIVPLKYDSVWNFRDGFAEVCLNSRYGFINEEGKEICSLKYNDINLFSEGLAAFELNNKWGFINKEGTEIIPLKYNKVWNFSDGFAVVYLNLRYGFINKDGKEICSIKYDDVWDFSEGYGAVKLNGKYGFINKEGTEIIPLKYDYVDSFKDGKAKVELNGEEYYIDKMEKIVNN